MTETLSEPTTKQVPEAAFLFDLGRVQFAAGESKDGRTPLTILARSGKPIVHWYWGQVIHDMAGMRLAGDRCPVDYIHNDWEVIGYGSKFDTSSGDLVISGELVSFQEDDRAAEVAFKGRAGVPYEASIFFDPCNGLRVEEVAPGVAVTVNGQNLVGPATVFRQWLLRGVSVCPYGADPNSSTSFSQKKSNQITVTFSKGQEMSTEKPADNKPADVVPAGATQLEAKPAVAPPAAAVANTAADPRVEFQANLTKFVSSFGAENGAKWAAEGKSFEEACQLHIAAQATQLQQRDQKIGELQTKLAAVNTGEKDPVSFTSGEAKDQGNQPANASKFTHLSTGMAKFAGGIKLPGAK
jgi:hypothetical protein